MEGAIKEVVWSRKGSEQVTCFKKVMVTGSLLRTCNKNNNLASGLVPSRK